MSWLAPVRIWWRLVVIEFRGCAGLARGRWAAPDPLAPANLDLDFDRPLPIHGWLGGVKKRAGKIAIIVDEPREVAAQLRTWAGAGVHPPASAADR